jgi:hypothetical protein
VKRSLISEKRSVILSEFGPYLAAVIIAIGWVSQVLLASRSKNGVSQKDVDRIYKAISHLEELTLSHLKWHADQG